MVEDIFTRCLSENVLHASQTHRHSLEKSAEAFFVFFPKVHEDDQQWNSRARGMRETRTFSRSSLSKRFVYIQELSSIIHKLYIRL
ncbi:hypothetical protein AtNW77_Chr5g0086911 [Arabidopsis thaliana]|uniref:Uncharacterized protein n=4 Tax=Arabidopsis TaxID=3701 RepID=Q0WRE7_ARATH|nr:uncharacterized protein AT5G03995 [Arabidopsis thaliana]KAG7601091.1 hypothetical protein ISN45_At05g003080 [Arabidopsis thaliana x Arabidopsis arenosa]KAG7608037.1 hypothetical protein ISN44_As05g003140 [Arabidopsis suecica]AED90681.1 hypothetical protein AT5G03995 [Arabidopsis thaliana]VYS65796.1 unnamed protein product [Arabidopsis thaliana]BAF00302.1 hypothetical protein [Arabidopsis thaliana]|eukprot:NP_001119165.1 hypothetical protein AT5G03995 [Arabidopsis thaliana]